MCVYIYICVQIYIYTVYVVYVGYTMYVYTYIPCFMYLGFDLGLSMIGRTSVFDLGFLMTTFDKTNGWDMPVAIYSFYERSGDLAMIGIPFEGICWGSCKLCRYVHRSGLDQQNSQNVERRGNIQRLNHYPKTGLFHVPACPIPAEKRIPNPNKIMNVSEVWT